MKKLSKNEEFNISGGILMTPLASLKVFKSILRCIKFRI